MTIQASGLQVLELGGLGLGSSRFGFRVSGLGFMVFQRPLLPYADLM